MSLANPFGTKVDDVSTVTGAEFTACGAAVAKAVDGTGGGTYTPTAPVIFGGSGLQMSGTSNVLLASRNIIRVQPRSGGSSLSGNWSLTTSPRIQWQNTASGGLLWWEMPRLLHGAVLNSVNLVWIGAAGHGAFPAGAPTMPIVEVFSVSSDGTQVSLGTVTDTSATAAIYQANHNLVVSVAQTIDLATKSYLVEITGETGANFITGAKPISLAVSCAATGYSEY